MKPTGKARNDRQFMATRAVLNLPRSEAGSGRRWLVLAAACSGTFAGFGSVVVFTFGVFMQPLAKTFGWSRGEISLAFTLAALMVAVCSPFLGRLIDRYPARRIILPCTLTYALAFGSLGLLTPHIGHFLAVFVLLGVVANGTTQLGYARVVSAWFDRSRGRALAAVMAGSGAGSMIFPPLAQEFITLYGWRAAYGILAGVIVLLGIPLTAVFLYEPQKESEPAETYDELQRKSSARAHVLRLPFVCLMTALALFSLATNGITAHFPLVLVGRGVTPMRAATIVSLTGSMSLLSRFLTGFLIDKLFAPRVLVSLFVASAGGVLLFTAGHSVAVLCAGAVLLGLGLGAESDSIPYLLTRYFGLAVFSELYGYTWSVYAVAGALGPLLMGGLFDHTGSYRAPLLVCGIVILAAACCLLFLPKYGDSYHKWRTIYVETGRSRSDSETL